jgi:hypothetical protein
VLDVELGPLAVEFGLSDIAAIGQPPRIGETLAEHWRDESGHKKSSHQEHGHHRLPASAVAYFTLTRSCARQIRISVPPGLPTL